MKLDAQHLIAALALVAAGWMLATKAAASSSLPTAHNDVAGPSDWYTYAGGW